MGVFNGSASRSSPAARSSSLRSARVDWGMAGVCVCGWVGGWVGGVYLKLRLSVVAGTLLSGEVLA